MTRAIAALLFTLLTSSAAMADDIKPNILLIVTDDQGWADVGYHNDEVRTPNIDKLCSMGVELDAHYVQPQCTPTRVALLTGRYPSRFGQEPTKASNEPAFPKGTLTIASLLKELSYDTALMGKWHLGSTPDHGPKHFGFDHSYGSFAGAVGMYDHRYRLNKPPYTQTWHRNHAFIEGHENGPHVTDLVAKEAVRFLEEERDKPFFLYLPFHAPHTPLAEDQKWLDKVAHIKDPDRRLFLAAVAHVDDAIGQIVNAIENSVALENTIVIFTSDNGGMATGYRGGNYPPPDSKLKKGFSSNAPLRGGKIDAYEGGIRVPAFITWVGTLDAGMKSHRMHVSDWLPTLANLLGYEAPNDAKWDGRDVWPLLTGKQGGYDQLRTIYTTWNNHKREALHYGDMKIVRQDGKPWELYDLKADPNETADLAKQKPKVVAALVKLYEAERANDRP